MLLQGAPETTTRVKRPEQRPAQRMLQCLREGGTTSSFLLRQARLLSRCQTRPVQRVFTGVSARRLALPPVRPRRTGRALQSWGGDPWVGGIRTGRGQAECHPGSLRPQGQRCCLRAACPSFPTLVSGHSAAWVPSASTPNPSASASMDLSVLPLLPESS